MHAFRLRACLLLIVMVLALSACASASVSEVPTIHASKKINAMSKVLPVEKGHSALNPARLIIPTIDINAPVENVGTQVNADLATPSQDPWMDVGWYSLGPRPGERGSAVIDGHLDRPGGFPAVFWHLRDLHAGDEVLVKNSSGNTLRFQVTRIELYAPQDAPIQDIFGNGGGTFLNLITCAGDWIPIQHQTNQRLVVYTSLMKG